MPETKPTVAMLIVFGTMNSGKAKLPMLVTGLTPDHEIALLQTTVGNDETPLSAAKRCANTHLGDILRKLTNLPDEWQERDICLLGWVDTPGHRLEIFNLRWCAPPEIRKLGKGKLRCIALDFIDMAGPQEHLTNLALHGLPEHSVRNQRGLMDYPSPP